MLEEAERRVVQCEAAVAATRQTPAKVQPPSVSISRYLEDLRGALETDTDRARRLLVKMLGKVTLHRDGGRLLANVKRNLSGLLDVNEEALGRAGAGSPSPALQLALGDGGSSLVETGPRSVPPST